MRTVCFHGRRELDRGGDFLLAARIVGAAAPRRGLAAQVRTPMWPAAPGSPDRAIVRMNTSPLENLDVPRRYDLEVVCEPRLAVIPPVGDALLPGGSLLVNAPGAPAAAPPAGARLRWADLGALAGRLGAPLPLALAGSAWAALARLAPELGLSPDALEAGAADALGRELTEPERNLVKDSYKCIFDNKTNA